MAEVKSTKKVYSLDEIKYNEANKMMSILAWIPVVGFILLLVEKEDNFVRYNGAQSSIIGLFELIAWIPIIGWFIPLVSLILIIIGIVKSSQGERFDIPVLSDLALKIMGMLN